MQVTKPLQLGLSTRPIEYKKRFGLCISAVLHVPFDQGENGALWGEQSMWNFLAQEMAVPLIDEGVSKLTPEFLVHGHAFAPAAQTSACAVKASLAGKEKTILAFGPRYWDGKTISTPQAFEEMPISWEHAYGGVNHLANPVGKGKTPMDGVHWLPNLELPQDRLIRPDQVIQPAGFGQLDVMHPQRVQYRGTYDGRYLQEHSPGFVPDMDWRYFNLAPQDQWLDRPLVGDERYTLDHLHPTRPHIEGQLPNLRARIFAQYGGSNAKLREVPMRLTTVWFYPHAERYILLFHGLAEVSTDDGSDVQGLLGAVERLGEVKPDTHYIHVLELRADAKMGAVHSLRDSDLLPKGLSTADPDFDAAKKPFSMDGLQSEAQYQRAQVDVALAREQARSMGKDPDALGIKMPPRDKPPEGDGLAEYIEKQIKESERQQWLALDDTLAQVEAAMDFAGKNNLDLSALQHSGPPVYSAETHLKEIQANFGQSAVNEKLIYPKLIQKEDVERLGYLQSAHMQPPVPRMQVDEAASLRREMLVASSKGMRYFSGIDLTGADLSELDLRGFNFSGAWLENVNFTKSNISGADFSYAVLAHANMTEVVAMNTNFTGANLGRAQLQRAILERADLTSSIMMYCALGQTQLRFAKLKNAMILDTTWGIADWSGADLSGQIFYKLDLKGLCLAEADVSSCNFIDCDLTGLDFRGANLSATTFITCKLDRAQCQSANAKGVVLVKECSLLEADLSQAQFNNCNFGASDMTGVRMVKTNLDGANLSDAKISQSDWRLATAVGALLRKTNIKNSLLAGVNFSNAILQHADLRGCDLRRSNLFATDMSRVKLDGDVQLEGALLKRSRTWPRLTAEQQGAAP